MCVKGRSFDAIMLNTMLPLIVYLLFSSHIHTAVGFKKRIEKFKKQIVIGDVSSSNPILPWEVYCNIMMRGRNRLSSVKPEAPLTQGNRFFFSTLEGACKYAKINPLFYEDKKNYFIEGQRKATHWKKIDPSVKNVYLVYLIDAQKEGRTVSDACSNHEKLNYAQKRRTKFAADVYYFTNIRELCDFVFSDAESFALIKNHTVTASPYTKIPVEALRFVQKGIRIGLSKETKLILYTPKCEFNNFKYNDRKKRSSSLISDALHSLDVGIPEDTAIELKDNVKTLGSFAKNLAKGGKFKDAISTDVVDSVTSIVHIGSDIIVDAVDFEDDPDYVSQDTLDEAVKAKIEQRKQQTKSGLQDLQKSIVKMYASAKAGLDNIVSMLRLRASQHAQFSFFKMFVSLVSVGAKNDYDYMYNVEELSQATSRKQFINIFSSTFKLYVTPTFDYNILKAYKSMNPQHSPAEFDAFKTYLQSVNFMLLMTSQRCGKMLFDDEDRQAVEDYKYIFKMLT
uniref:Rhoptry-associated protein n=1 Tax=Steinernema glaseri TaxID=37863 RepID=A0A1I8ASR7_9BILA